MTENVGRSIRVENLPCKLTEKELRTAGSDLAGVVQDIATEADRHVDIKSQMKARLSELEARKSILAITISRREEYRDVEIEVLSNYDEGIVRRVRMDTGEVLHERPMREDERQSSLPMDEAQPYPAADGQDTADPSTDRWK